MDGVIIHVFPENADAIAVSVVDVAAQGTGADPTVINELVTANHILSDQGNRRCLWPCQCASRQTFGSISARAQHGSWRRDRRGYHRIHP